VNDARDVAHGILDVLPTDAEQAALDLGKLDGADGLPAVALAFG
jgi:hypothetical protein